MIEHPSQTWEGGAEPAVSVVVSSFGRSGYLAELFDALEQQDLGYDAFEVVVVDNGSKDDTWATLQQLVARTPLRLLAVHLPENRGPGGGRNAGAGRARAPVIAITDDDCLPTPGWVRRVRDAFADGVVSVLQGRVEPRPEELAQAAPWDHTIWVTEPSPFFETCNVAYRRDGFDAVGGFDEDDPLFRPRSGRAFGEDAVLAWRILERGGAAAFADEAVVHHRCVPGTFLDHVRDVRHAAGFPGLAQRSPLVAEWLRGGLFLSGNSFAFDLGVLGVVASLGVRRPGPLLALAPWLWFRGTRAVRQAHGDLPRAAVVLAQFAAVDATILASLLEGSVRHRRLIL